MLTDISLLWVSFRLFEACIRITYSFIDSNSLGRNHYREFSTPGEVLVIVNSYSQGTFSAVKSHLRRFGATNIDTDMEIYIWTEYLYRLREKYFGGGEGPPLAKMKQM